MDGRKLTFAVRARDEVETIGEGAQSRVVVEVGRFEARLARKITPR